MIVGVPKEIKTLENRVSMTPAGVHALTVAGHTVLVEREAGCGSGFADEDYAAAGAAIEPDKAALFDRADMIVKVKEPLPEEYDLFHSGQILFTYLHLASDAGLTRALMARRIVGIAYETVTGPGGSLPLLSPMSEVAGRMATQVGAHYLLHHYGGRGILLGGVAGVPPGLVVIVGGGTVGLSAARMAVGLGAQVTIIEKSLDRLRHLDDMFQGRVVTVRSNPFNIATWVARADLLVGAVLIPGARAPKLVSADMVKTMKPGSVIVDVAIDQGGSIETIDHVTTHADPVYVRDGVLHYAVANMPGAAPRTSTFALTNATLDHTLALADKGWKRACLEDPGLARGVNLVDGYVTYRGVAEAHQLPFMEAGRFLEEA